MKVPISSRYSGVVRWQQRGAELLRQASQRLQRLLTLDRPPEALVLIPIRAVQPQVARQPRRRIWSD